MRVFHGLEELRAGVGEPLGPSEFIVLDQAAINGFAEVTRDHQWIHIDEARAASGPFGGTIAHGFLTVSLVPYFLNQLRSIEGATMGVNYGLDKVRFPAPVPAGSEIRASGVMTSVDDVGGGGAQVVSRVTIEARGAAKPSCVADIVARYYF